MAVKSESHSKASNYAQDSHGHLEIAVTIFNDAVDVITTHEKVHQHVEHHSDPIIFVEELDNFDLLESECQNVTENHNVIQDTVDKYNSSDDKIDQSCQVLQKI